MSFQINGTTYFENKKDASTSLDKKTLIQVCSSFGYHIPRFCYHDKLSVAGNCRMCLVELSNGIKPVASCAMPFAKGTSLFTDTYTVKKAREGVLEFLLLNHPLDCPICDQGGECDLQDQSLMFGNDRGRFYGYKNSTGNKDCGPLIKTIMTRCIHCTRCVRFSKEIAGIEDFGVTGRGSQMEIGMYVNKIMSSEISGNVIDLCPVGALTSKSYAFSGRPWELQSVSTIDTMDSMGSHIKIDKRGNDLLRILPQLNEDINGEWITDAARFSYDGFQKQRLLLPILYKNRNIISTSTWKLIFNTLKLSLFNAKNSNAFKKSTANLENKNLLTQLQNSFFYKKVGVGIGSLIENRDLFYLKLITNKSGGFFLIQSNNLEKSNSDFRSFYKCNSSFNKIELSECTLLIGFNSRIELPLLHARLMSLNTINNFENIYYLGSYIESSSLKNHLGNSVFIFNKLLSGLVKMCSKLVFSKRVSVFVGSSILERKYNSFILKCLNLSHYSSLLVKEQNLLNNYSWNGINIISFSTNFVGNRDINILPKYSTSTKFFSNNIKRLSCLYSLGESFLLKNNKNSSLIIYQGHHFINSDIIRNPIDILLPTLTSIEKESILTNTEGRIQKSYKVLNFNHNGREHWAILKYFGFLLHCKKTPSTIKEIDSLLLKQYGHKLNSNLFNEDLNSIFLNNTVNTMNTESWLESFVVDYYKTNEILKSSLYMARSSRYKNNVNFKF